MLGCSDQEITLVHPAPPNSITTGDLCSNNLSEKTKKYEAYTALTQMKRKCMSSSTSPVTARYTDDVARKKQTDCTHLSSPAPDDTCNDSSIPKRNPAYCETKKFRQNLASSSYGSQEDLSWVADGSFGGCCNIGPDESSTAEPTTGCCELMEEGLRKLMTYVRCPSDSMERYSDIEKKQVEKKKDR